MKHIGWCLDQIQIVMMDMPRQLTTPATKIVANSVLDDVQQYHKTLVEIITNPEFRTHLNRLETASIEGIRLQAHQIEELVKDLEHMLQVLDLYIRELRDIITNRPEEWSGKADQIVLMIDQKFGGERGELRKEFQVAVHAEEQLRQLVTSEQHLAEFLK